MEGGGKGGEYIDFGRAREREDRTTRAPDDGEQADIREQ